MSSYPITAIGYSTVASYGGAARSIINSVIDDLAPEASGDGE